MKAILYGDISLFLKSKSDIVFNIINIILAFVFNRSFFLVISMWHLIIIPASSIQNDGITNYLKTIFTFPISRDEYVKSKFVFAFLCNMICVFLTLSFSFLSYLRTEVFQWQFIYLIIVFNIFLSFFSIFVSIAVNKPNISTVIILSALLPFVIAQLHNGFQKTLLMLLGNVTHFISSNTWLALLISFLTLTSIFVTFYFLSLYAFRKKTLLNRM